MSNERTISPELQAHLDSGTTTTTILIRIDPPDPKFDSFGMTKLDKDVIYDDGAGELTYSASIGMVPAELVTGEAMDVGNSEFDHLLPQFSIPINEDLIRAGVYDYATYTIYLVNYEDLSMGHVIMPAGYGQVGRMTVDASGMAFKAEFTDLTKELKQNIVEKDSITCRAIFGSQPIGSSDSSGDVIEQRFPCGKDVSGLWTDGTVTTVGLESNRTFTDSGLGLAADADVPGIVKWETGANAGRTFEVESQDAAGVVTLGFETQFPIENGDTFRIRPDCTKWVYGHNGCQEHFSDVSPVEWKLHYRGEPFIPLSDADAINTPGATVGTGV